MLLMQAGDSLASGRKLIVLALWLQSLRRSVYNSREKKQLQLDLVLCMVAEFEEVCVQF